MADGRKKKPKGDGKKNELRKAVEAVHSSSSLGFLANKLLNVFVHNALNDIGTRETFRISVAEAAKLSGFNSNNTRILKLAARELREKTIEWDTLGKNGSWGVTSFLSEVKIANGIIEYSIPPTIRTLFSLGEGRAWAQINLDFVATFGSNLTLKLYENCVRYRGTGSTGAKTVAEWRGLLQANAAMYDEFRYLRRVIEQAIKEVNEKTDIQITADYIREGRSVAYICFYVTSIQHRLPDTVDSEILRRICSLGVPEKTGRKYIAEYEADYLEGNLALVEQRYKDGIITKNPAAYLKNALAEDYRVIKTALDLEREDELARKAAAEAAKVAAEKTEQERLQRRASDAKDKFDALKDDAQDTLIGEFSEHIRQTNSFLSKQIQKTGISGQMVLPVFNQWLADKFGL